MFEYGVKGIWYMDNGSPLYLQIWLLRFLVKNHMINPVITDVEDEIRLLIKKTNKLEFIRKENLDIYYKELKEHYDPEFKVNKNTNTSSRFKDKLNNLKIVK